MIRYKGFADLVDRMAASAPDKVALLHAPKGEVLVVTWRELAALVDARAGELATEGCRCEAILADGTLGCIVETFAAVHAGLQVALIDPLMPNRVIDSLLQAVDADCVWASSEKRKAELARNRAPLRPPANGAQAILFFTSGTTSSSKAVVLTDETLMASAFNGSSLLPLSERDTLLCLLPLSHVFGFVCGLLWGLACGATVALGRGPRSYANDLDLFAPTAISVVPRLLEFFVAHDLLCPSLELVLVGASDCSDDLLGAVRSRNIRVSLGYGLTETSSGVALSIGDDFHAMTVCPDDEVTIAADGEVLVCAPTCLMRGYYRDDEKTASVVRDGVLHTGDLGYLDDEGLLHVTGRKKDVLALPNGTKVFLPDYEAALAVALGERDVAVILDGGMMTLACGKLEHMRDDHSIMGLIAPAMAAYPPVSRIARIVRLGHALERTAAGDVERWKIQKELSALPEG